MISIPPQVNNYQFFDSIKLIIFSCIINTGVSLTLLPPSLQVETFKILVFLLLYFSVTSTPSSVSAELV